LASDGVREKLCRSVAPRRSGRGSIASQLAFADPAVEASMPAHLHDGAQCAKVGQVCGGAACAVHACLNGGRLLSCEKTPSGRFLCFHAEYYLGGDVLTDAQAAQAKGPAPAAAATAASPAPTPGNVTLPAGASPAAASPPAPPDPIGDAIVAFSRRTGDGVFPNISRQEVAATLLQRMRYRAPSQRSANTCGAAAFAYVYLDDHPAEYATFVTELYEHGTAKLGELEIKTSATFREQPVGARETAADWLALGGIRDSTNWIFSYEYNSNIEWLRGGTTVGEVVKWLNGAGYKDVQDWPVQGEATLRLANQYYDQGYKVILKVDGADMLGDSKAARSLSLRGDHFVVLTSRIDHNSDGIFCTVFTWGSLTRRIPQVEPPAPPGRMPTNTFIDKWYRMIVGKP